MIKQLFATLCAGIFMAGSHSSPLLHADEKASPRVLIMLGPPGAGKGTQAALLQQKTHLPHISTGDLLRDHVRQETELGKKAKTFMSGGQLVPDQLIMDMLFDRVSQPDCAQGYILDGFPRTLTQAQALQEKLQKQTKPLVINLELEDAEIIERLSKRVTCEQCGTPYHLAYSPPKIKDECDKCRGKLIQRSDDHRDVVIKRLKVYHEQTAPLIRFYNKLNILHSVSCKQSKEQVFTQILGKLN